MVSALIDIYRNIRLIYGVSSRFSGGYDDSTVRKHVSLFIGSVALGGGVWSMHFIGMLALELCTDVSYRFDLTALSIFPAIAASWVALNLLTRDNLRMFQLILGGVLVGAGIGSYALCRYGRHGDVIVAALRFSHVLCFYLSCGDIGYFVTLDKFRP